MEKTTKEVFTQQDEALHKGLIHLLNTGTWNLTAKDAVIFSKVIDWTVGIPQKFDGLEVKPPPAPDNPALKDEKQ